MPLIIPTASEGTLLGFTLGTTTPGNQILKLFVNNVTETNDALVAADFTEMTTHGYASKTLTKTSWVVTPNTGAAASAAYAAQTWTFTAAAAVTVYGYYITDTTTGLLLWFEEFTTPKVVENTGDQIIITPAITLSKV
jgi:hypothetical protein